MAERGQCRWCGNPVRWYDTATGNRVPLMPQQFPTSAIPPKYRWCIDAGTARHGVHPADPDQCHLNHALVCPCRTDRDQLNDFTTPLERIRTALGIAHQKLLDRGFQPAPPPDPHPTDQPRETGEERHVLAHGDSWLRLLPSRVENLQCIAFNTTTRGRCPQSVYRADEGAWRPIPIAAHGSRTAQTVHERHNGTMWVWALTTPTGHPLMRWYQQRCPDHATPHHPLAVEPELLPFDVVRHSQYILGQRPTGYDTTTQTAPTWIDDGRQSCSTTGCPHGNSGPHIPNWLCWKCKAKANRRPKPPAHSRWRALVADLHQPPPGHTRPEPPTQ